MAEYWYYVIEFDGRNSDTEPINPRIYFENGRCRFRYDGPVPGYWGTHIRRRHGLGLHHIVTWDLDRKPVIPGEGVIDDAVRRSPVFVPPQ